MDVNKLVLDENKLEGGRMFEDSVKKYEEERKMSHIISMELKPKIIEIYGRDPFIKVDSF